jgi:prevent-host-death family protein
MTEMSASEARAGWAQVLRTVRGGEPVTVTQHGEPAAVVVSIDTWRKMRQALEDGADIDAAQAAADRLAAGAAVPVSWEELAPQVAELVTPAVLAEVRAELGLTGPGPEA